MRILLIGDKSYVGRSITSIASSDIDWISISRKDFESPYQLEYFKNLDAVVVIATPAMSSVDSEWDLDERVKKFLVKSSLPKICISSIRAGDVLTEENKNYINALNRFEAYANTYNWTILRISNFLGVPPGDFPNQKRLLPWNLLHTIVSEDVLNLKSVANQLTEWVNAEDVVHAIQVILTSKLFGKFITRPSFEIKLFELVDLMVCNFRSLDRPISIKYGVISRPKIVLTSDERLTQIGWKTNVNVEILLEKIIAYSNQKSVRGN
jgi:hypothetical protein